MAKKKAKSKKKTAPKAVTKNTSNVAFMTRSRSKYVRMFERVSKLTLGKSLVMKRKKGQTSLQLLNCIGLAFHHHPHLVPEPPTGCKFVRRRTEQGNVAVCCVEA